MFVAMLTIAVHATYHVTRGMIAALMLKQLAVFVSLEFWGWEHKKQLTVKLAAFSSKTQVVTCYYSYKPITLLQ